MTNVEKKIIRKQLNSIEQISKGCNTLDEFIEKLTDLKKRYSEAGYLDFKIEVGKGFYRYGEKVVVGEKYETDKQFISRIKKEKMELEAQLQELDKKKIEMENIKEKYNIKING